jgi:acetyl-CoA carboxylase biotin carboxyl carrier protein
MTKIDKIDIENINFLKKELKLQNIRAVKIKKGNYEIEISSGEVLSTQNIKQFTSQTETTSESNQKTKQKTETKLENIVKSPMVGVVYLSSDPSSPPYVKEGQHVKQGDILMLIEAMKTFNEIKAPRSGVIKKIIALNSQPVEFGDSLVIFE